MWRKYEIGNGLRGTIEVKARSVREAWERGRKRFNRAFPTTSRSGRYVYMSVYDDTVIPILKTKYVIEQENLPKQKRHFHNFDSTEHRGWIPVAQGMSKQKLIN